MHPDQGLLRHVLGLRDAAQHPVGDRERERPQLVEELFALCHAAASPSRQVGCAGCQRSSRLALAFEAPRISVIIITPASPANSRATKRGMRMGFLAPSSCASTGSHSATGAGSSSTTLYTPRLPRSMAATVASAASAMWMNDQTPPPSPTSGNLRLRTSSNCSPPGVSDMPGP